MPEILHRFTIDAPPERVNELIATAAGVERWWTGHENSRDGRTLGVFFGGEDPAAVFDVIEDDGARVVWRVLDGPAEWIGTTITFDLERRSEEETTLLFTHAGWDEAGEFMANCTTNWGAYLTSLKLGAEGGAFAAYPAGEMSRRGRS